MAEIGHNGGPKIQKFTASKKVERIQELLELDSISAAQKCVGIGIICEADTDWVTPELSAGRLQRFANVKDPETVYRATRKLAAENVVNTVRVEGKPNKYVVLPSEAIDAVLDEIDATTPISSEPSPPVKSDGYDTTRPLRSDRSTPSDQTGVVHDHHSDLIGVVHPTTPIETGGFSPATPVEPDPPAPTPSRARVENNNKININTSSVDRGEEKDRGCGGKEKPDQSGFSLEAEEDDVEAKEAKASPLEAFNLYNEMALRVGLPQAATLTPQRRKLIAARMREHGGMEAWKTALANIEKSAFLQGSNDRGWRASLDFLCQAKSFTKCVEGTYGNGAHGSAPGPQKPKVTDRDRIAEIAREIEEKERQKAPNWRVPREH